MACGGENSNESWADRVEAATNAEATDIVENLPSNPGYECVFQRKQPFAKNGCRRRIWKDEAQRFTERLSAKFCLMYIGAELKSFSCKEEKEDYENQIVRDRFEGL